MLRISAEGVQETQRMSWRIGLPVRVQTQADGQLQVDRQLLAYLEAHRGSASFLFATLSSQTAAPYIIASGQPVMALGGFSGSDQILSLSRLQATVRARTIRYFLLDGAGGGFGGAGGNGGNAQLVQWVESNCTPVAASAYGGSSTGSGTLYVCSSAGERNNGQRPEPAASRHADAYERLRVRWGVVVLPCANSPIRTMV
jgi:hypothetical protein